MVGELFARVLVSDAEREEIKRAILVMEDVIKAYSKTGVQSVEPLIDDLHNGISALKGVLNGIYY